MKTIYKLALAELQTLFYSPVAWLILIIFTFQAGMVYTNLFGGLVRAQSLGYPVYNVTAGTYFPFFRAMQQYLYFYIPLLTMGIMSRELGSGSIKLLYSSPVTNTQIILGKYLSLMLYCFVLIGVLIVFVFFGVCTIKMVDIPYMLSGLLGLYLLLCAYAAIGLFMSSITSYQVVAAMGTLAVLAVLSYVKGMWQGIEFVKDITFWLSIDGRADEFIGGLICSEDFLYFVIVIAMFLMLCILRLQARRQRISWIVRWGKYLGVVGIAMLLGYLSSRPVFMSYYDASRTKFNTLTPNSQEIVKKLDGGLTITTFTNILDNDFYSTLPENVNWDKEVFKQYVRFKPEIKMKYVYFYADAQNKELDKMYPNMTDKERARKMIECWGIDSTIVLPPEEIKKIIDLEAEKNHSVRLVERENGQRIFLRFYEGFDRNPREGEISAAFKRLIMKLPIVGFLQGHGERDPKKEGDRDYNRFSQDKWFRYALINQGFDVAEVTLDKDIAPDIEILVIAEMKSALTPEERMRLDAYIERGGNLLILGEPRRRDIMNQIVEPLGVKFLPGVLVKPTENFQADLIITTPTKEAGELSYPFQTIIDYEGCVTFPGSSALAYAADKGYSVTPLFMSDTAGSWNELQTTDFIDDVATLNLLEGEKEESLPIALALSRKVGEKEQRIIIFGDADCISNGELGMQRKDVWAMNFNILTGSFFWLSHEEVPIDMRRPTPPDNAVYVGEIGMSVAKIGFLGVFPAILIFFALFIWIRRRGR